MIGHFLFSFITERLQQLWFEYLSTGNLQCFLCQHKQKQSAMDLVWNANSDQSETIKQSVSEEKRGWERQYVIILESDSSKKKK